MRKYFYHLEYRIFYRYDKEDNEKVEEKHLVGFFSSKLNAMEAIKVCLKFENINKENFQIKRVRINFENYPKIIYYPEHEFAIHKENGDIIDYYYSFAPKATRKEAFALCEEMKKKRKYRYRNDRDYAIYPPDGFVISELIIDKIYFHGF